MFIGYFNGEEVVFIKVLGIRVVNFFLESRCLGITGERVVVRKRNVSSGMGKSLEEGYGWRWGD